MAAAETLGSDLTSKFAQYEKDRLLAELKWARNARQYLGIYDPEVESQLGAGSKAYPKLTRVKCVSMLARLMNLLFPTDDKNWTVAPSPVPELGTADLDAVIQKVMATAQEAQVAPTNDMIEQEVVKVAQTRATRLELEIEDQLRELGGNSGQDYIALARKVLASGIQYGTGVLKGPFIATEKQRTWDIAGANVTQKIADIERPRYEFVSIWDYYPDMTAKTFDQMEGQFQRELLTIQQLAALKKRPDFLVDQITKVQAALPSGNYKRRQFESELKAMGVHQNVADANVKKYEAIVWSGFVSGKVLFDMGIEVSEDSKDTDLPAIVWVVGGTVIKADVDPWYQLMQNEAPRMYHHFVFEEDESSLLGNGLPNIMRDSQMGVCAGTRMVLDNASIAAGLNLEVNLALLDPLQDTSSIQPNKIWYRDDDAVATATLPAVKAIEIPSRVAELKQVIELFSQFADQETFVSVGTGGDMQKGPSEPFRTAAGASMLRGDAALPFKDVVRNYDAFTQSFVGSLIAFNKKFNKNPDVAGDFKPIARGATSLIAKEVLGLQLDSLVATLSEEEKMYVNMHALAKARMRSRDLEIAQLVVSDAEAKNREAAAAQKAAADQATQAKMIEAQIREILSQTLKNLSQAGKNSAAAEATTANVILNAVEKGLSPDAITRTAGEGAVTGEAAGQPTGTASASTGAVPAAGAGIADATISEGGGGAVAGDTGGSQASGFAPIPDQQAA
jgi:hypothetical protein